MSQTKLLVIVAGAALGVSQAMAQTTTLDQGRALNAELIADAGTRASLLQGGTNNNTTYAGTFGIGDSTGANRLNFGGTQLLRYSASQRDSDTQGDVNDLTLGFSTPVTRLRFWGNVWDKNLTFKVQGNFGGEFSDTGSFGLEDAYAQYAFDGGFSVKWGQFKMPVVREVSVEDEYQLAADRSVAARVFSPGYSQGVQFGFQQEAWRFAGGLTDGVNTANTDFNSGAEADFAVNAGFGWKVMGASWDRFNDYTSWRSATDNAFLINIGGVYQSGGETGFTADVDTILASVDASFEGQGWNASVAGYLAHVDPAGGTDTDNYGVMAQAGIFVSDQVELFGRYNAIFFDKDSGANPATLHFAEAGMNYYVSKESHACKFTGQFEYAFNDTSALYGTGGLLAGNTRNGFLGDSEKGEWGITAQMQLVW